MTWRLVGLLAVMAGAVAQSNYADQANSIEFPNEGLPDSTVLDGKVTKLDDLAPVIFLNRTKAALNCAAGYMQIELKFDEPFYGIAYADFDRTSACQVSGRGNLTARLDLPLKGCGTKQDPQRVFTNNIVVRFHPALEMDGDEVITIVCRYPPPVAPPPAGIPGAILEPSAPLLPVAPPLKGFQILLIICGILFLSLVLLGLGCSYYLLKRRRVQVVRRHPFSTGTGSEITKLTGSSLSNISMFEGLKIPRVHAIPASGSTSGSDAALISGGDTLPSDYPSESPSSAHSEIEDIETRSLHRSVSSHGSYDNKAYIQEASSMYSEGYVATEIITAATSVIKKPPPPEPKFDVQVRVKRAPPPPPTPTPPPSESEASLRMQERNLTTILEREELVRSIPKPNVQTFTYVPELHPPPPPKATPPPIYSKVIRKPAKIVEETYTHEDTVDIVRRRPSLTSLNTEMTETRSMSEIVERSHQKRAPPPPPIAPSQMYTSEMEVTTEELIEPQVVPRRPEITSHVVDDVFLRTITEKRTIEDIERHRRQITEYHPKPQPPPPKWDVTIRNYPNPDAQPSGDEGTTDWESFSETSSLSSYPTPQTERHRVQHHRNEVDIHQSYRSTLEIPVRDPNVRNWDVLIRVLEPPLPEIQPMEERRETYRVEETLTLEDRKKWREIITTESTLRTLLTEATVREDYERIRKDQRYEKLFEPQKWDVIIRVLAPPEKPQYDQKGAPGNNKYRRKADWDTRSRRSSLPTLYEYDSDGGSSVRTLTADPNGPPGVDPILRSRRTSRSSMRSDGMDVRSMSEVTVDFAQRNMPDNMSDASSYYRPRSYYDDDDLIRHGRGFEDEDGVSLVRSVSQPSLARSASEFTEQWGVRARPWDLSSPEHSPRSARSQRLGGATMAYSVRETSSSYKQSQGWFGDADSEASYK